MSQLVKKKTITEKKYDRMNNSEKEKIRRRLAAQNFLENISLDGSKQPPKSIGRKRSVPEDSEFL